MKKASTLKGKERDDDDADGGDCFNCNESSAVAGADGCLLSRVCVGM